MNVTPNNPRFLNQPGLFEFFTRGFDHGLKDLTRLSRILAQAKAPMKDAAAVNATRWKIFNALKATGLPVTTGSGAQTKFNRVRLGIRKGHALDAACVGDVSGVHKTVQPVIQV